KGLRMTFSPTQLKKMVKHGGFIGALLPFLSQTVLPILTGTVLPALASGAIGSVGAYGMNKAINAIKGEGLTNFALFSKEQAAPSWKAGGGLTNFGEVSTGGCVKPKLIGGMIGKQYGALFSKEQAAPSGKAGSKTQK